MINLYRLLNQHFQLEIDEDIRTLLDEELRQKPEELAIHIYRVQRQLLVKNGDTRLSDLLMALSYLQRMYTQIEIYYSAEIGKNFKIIHGLGSVIGARVTIGDNVTIYQNVTLGDKAEGSNGRPVIGNDVKIYAGAKVLGGITIGNNVSVGANSVVLHSFEDNVMIAGVPANIIKKR